jgi:phage terminase large subunit
VSEVAALSGTYMNLRAELWFKAKSWLEKLDCKLPKDERLQNELVVVRYGFQTGSSKMKIESKDDIKRRGLQSPDVADAFVLTFASDAGVALYGTSYTSDWKRPIRRKLSLV